MCTRMRSCDSFTAHSSGRTAAAKAKTLSEQWSTCVELALATDAHLRAAVDAGVLPKVSMQWLTRVRDALAHLASEPRDAASPEAHVDEMAVDEEEGAEEEEEEEEEYDEEDDELGSAQGTDDELDGEDDDDALEDDDDDDDDDE